MDIACIQETKWKGAKARDIHEGYTIIYYGTKTTQKGIAVVISKQFRDNVVEVDSISDCLISVKIILGSTTIHIISCYAPQTGRPEDVKDDLWESLDAHL